MLCKAWKRAPIAIYAVLKKKKKTGLDKKKKKSSVQHSIMVLQPSLGEGARNCGTINIIFPKGLRLPSKTNIVNCKHIISIAYAK